MNTQAGTYTETAQVVVPIGVDWEGVDSSTTIIRSTLTAQFVPMVALNSGTQGTNGNNEISNLKFDGQSLSTSFGLSVAARSNVSVHDCSFVNFFDIGCSFTGLTTPNGDGEASSYGTDNSFYNNKVWNCAANDSVGAFKYGRGNFQFGSQLRMLVYGNNIEQPYRSGGTTNNIGWPVKYATGGFFKDCKVYES